MQPAQPQESFQNEERQDVCARKREPGSEEEDARERTHSHAREYHVAVCTLLALLQKPASARHSH